MAEILKETDGIITVKFNDKRVIEIPSDFMDTLRRLPSMARVVNFYRSSLIISKGPNDEQVPQWESEENPMFHEPYITDMELSELLDLAGNSQLAAVLRGCPGQSVHTNESYRNWRRGAMYQRTVAKL